jgi:16S rRNA (uracil1498-N3)-methyltransferase
MANALGKRLVHWQSVIVAACEQMGRAVVPAIARRSRWRMRLRTLTSSPALRLLLDPKAGRALATRGG